MRMLIVGGGGMLGHKLWQHFSRHPTYSADTWVTLRKRRNDYSHTDLFPRAERVVEGLDVSSFASLESVLNDLRPQVILNCVAVTKRHVDPSDVASLIALNSLLPHHLASWASRQDSRLIHFSTDCVFDGRQSGHTESDLTNAEDAYGRTKALGEAMGPSALTLRSSFIGREIGGFTELVEWFLTRKGSNAKGYRRALYTGLTTPVTVRLVQHIIERHPNLHGLYQVASDPINKFELLKLLNESFNLGVNVEPEDQTVVLRDLDGTRFSKATGFVAPSWRSMIEELAKDPTPYAQWRTRA